MNAALNLFWNMQIFLENFMGKAGEALQWKEQLQDPASERVRKRLFTSSCRIFKFRLQIDKCIMHCAWIAKGLMKYWLPYYGTYFM